MIVESRTFVHNETTDTPVARLDTMEYSLKDANEYFNITAGGMQNKIVTDDRTTYLLGRLGYEKKDIETVLKGCYYIEMLIAEGDMLVRDGAFAQQKYTKDDLNEISKNYPVTDILEARGAGYDRFQYDIAKLSVINALYTADNLEDIKRYFIVHLLAVTEDLLDTEALKNMYNRTGKINGGEPYDDELFVKRKDSLVLVNIQKSYMLPALYETWFEKHYDQKTVDDITSIVNDYRDYYIDLLNNIDRLSEDARDMAVKKVEHLAVHVGKPSIEVDYIDCNIKTAKEGGSFLEACAESFRYHSKFKEKILKLGNSNDIWDHYETNALESNAYYDPAQNAIYILWGFIQDPLYSPDMSYEEKLGGIGVFIGHEITHAFDVNGSQSDYEGNLISWMSGEDSGNFSERTSKVSAYYRMIIPIKGAASVNGEIVADEAIADLGGIKGAQCNVLPAEGFQEQNFKRQSSLTASY